MNKLKRTLLVLALLPLVLGCNIGARVVTRVPAPAPSTPPLSTDTPAPASGYHETLLPITQVPGAPTPIPSLAPALFLGPRQAGSALDAGITDVATADVDGDGDLDLIAVYPAGPELAICYNDGSGAFGPPWYVNEYAGTADLLQSVTAADIDGDGDIDLVSATWNGFFGVSGDENSLAINRNRGDGTFEPATLTPVSHPTTQVIAADFNGDGKVDIAATYKDTDAIVVLPNPGQGQFSDYQDYVTGQNLWSLSVGDVNSDGRPDLVAVALSGDISLLINQGDGSFLVRHLTLAAGVQDIAAGDFDQDGDQDLVALNSADNTLTILHNRGNADFDTSQLITSTHWLNSVVVADFNNDDRLDLAVANYDDITVSVYSGDGQGGFSLDDEFIIGREPHDILAADVNGDGHPDIIAGADGIWASVILNQGDGTFKTIDPPYTIGPRPVAMETTDLDGDGFPDLVVYHNATSYRPILTTLLNDGHGYFSIGQEIEGYSPLPAGGISPEHPLVASDFDGDGDSDVVFASRSGLCVLRNNGQGEIQSSSDAGDCASIPAAPEGSFRRINVLRAADFDHDGDTDVVAAMNDSIIAFYNNGRGQFENPQAILSQGSGVLTVTDLNGDGLADIVVSDAGTHNQQLLVIVNQGSGTFVQPAAFDAVYGCTYSGLATGDLDGDRDLDLALIYQTTAFVPTKGQVYLNDGAGRFSTGSDLLFPGQSPNDVALADIDLDGDLDVLGTTSWNRTVTVNFNDGTGWFDRSDPLLASVITRPEALVVADFDQDGDIDVATVGDERDTDLSALTIRVNALLEPPKRRDASRRRQTAMKRQPME